MGYFTALETVMIQVINDLGLGLTLTLFSKFSATSHES